jgi:hypothetical protein
MADAVRATATHAEMVRHMKKHPIGAIKAHQILLI